MRRLLSLYLIVFCIPLNSFSQDLQELDYVSPFHEGMAAVKRGSSWGFIDQKGVLVVNFREDLVLKTVGGEQYPAFSSGRCLISIEKEGISYFGFIDRKGNTIIEPEFLNATHFEADRALVLKLYKNTLGRNDVLDKGMVDYSYNEVVIDTKGDIIHYVFEEPTHITLSKDFVDKAPSIKSKFLSNSLIATVNENRKWSVKKL